MAAAMRQKMINQEQRRAAKLQQQWKDQFMSAPVSEDTEELAASIYAADKECPQTQERT